jgi:hypothetical protein
MMMQLMCMTPSNNLLVSSATPKGRCACIFLFCHGHQWTAGIYIHTYIVIRPPHLVYPAGQASRMHMHLFDSFYYCRNCADRHPSDELEVLLSAQGSHHHHHHPSSSVIHPQLSSLLMMQDLGFQWSSCGSFVDTSSSPMPPPLVNGQQHDGHNKIKEWDRPLTANNSSRSSCASTAMACRDVVLDGGGGGGLPAMAAVAADLDDGTVLPASVNVPRTTTTRQRPFPAAPPPLPGDAFEILASSRLCKTLLLSQASSSVLLHNGTTMPLLRSEHVPYGPPAPAHPQGPSIGNYKQVSQIKVQCRACVVA